MFIFSWGNSLPDHGATILSAVIQAAGTIAAALIAAFYANRIVKGFQFHSYSNAPENVLTILKKARSDLFIITAVGDKLLSVSEEVLAQRLQEGIRVRYLLLDPRRFHEMEKYMHGKGAKDIRVYHSALTALSRLQEKYPGRLEVRLFSSHMTASYIGIDTCPDPARDAALFSPFIQVMLYQYHIRAKNSVLLYFYEKSDPAYYDATLYSMRDMWEDAAIRPVSRRDSCGEARKDWPQLSR